MHLTFRVPERKTFLQSDPPWMFARILRRTDSDSGQKFSEVGGLLDEQGFPFGEALSYDDSNVKTGETYTYRIELLKEKSRERAVSESLTIGLQLIPGVNGTLRAEGSKGAISLSWGEADAAPRGIRYQVYRGEKERAAKKLINREPLDTTRFVDIEVSREKEYCYEIRGLLRSGFVDNEGPPSQEVCARTEDRTPPGAPTGLQAVSSRDAFVLSWVSPGDADILGYHIYRSLGGGAFKRINTEPVRKVSYRDRDVLPGNDYRYRVTAVDTSLNRNESLFSNTVRGSFRAP